MKFKVSYTFGACIIVEADNEEDAEEIVEQKPTDELFAHARDGFEIQGIEETDIDGMINPDPNNDEFRCDKCKQICDIEDSIRIGKDLLYCNPCAEEDPIE